MIRAKCSSCNQDYPAFGAPYNCDRCGAHFEFVDEIEFKTDKIDQQLPGIWKYREFFHLSDDSPIVYLGEGDTPLVWVNTLGRKVGFKLEFLNPTGSFKDRGTSLLVSFLKSRGINSAVEDSSGNAGVSFAAYAARAGIHAKVFLPAYASGPKRDQIEAFGAEIVIIDGPRSAATDAALQAARNGETYASHAYFPIGIDGFATTAYELMEQMDLTPGTIVVPVGQGSLILGLARGFNKLYSAGLVENKPKLLGVQAISCAPLWAVFRYGAQGLGWVTEGVTLAEGVRIIRPIRGDSILNILKSEKGELVAVEEHAILQNQQRLAKIGLYVEPTSAIVWDALEKNIDNLPDPIVVILTGSGLKNNKITTSI